MVLLICCDSHFHFSTCIFFQACGVEFNSTSIQCFSSVTCVFSVGSERTSQFGWETGVSIRGRGQGEKVNGVLAASRVRPCPSVRVRATPPPRPSGGAQKVSFGKTS